MFRLICENSLFKGDWANVTRDADSCRVIEISVPDEASVEGEASFVSP